MMTLRLPSLTGFLAVLSAATFGAADPAPGSLSNAAAKPAKAGEVFDDQLVAKGKGVEIRRSQVDDAIITVKSTLSARGQNLNRDESDVLERQVLNDLIVRQLLLAKSTPADTAKGRTHFTNFVQTMKSRGKLSDEEFDQRLAPQLRLLGISRAQWEQRTIEEATLQAVLEREIQLEVTPAEAKKYYDDNTNYFEEPDRVKVSHILLSTKDATDTNPDPAMRRDLSDAQKQAKRKQIEELAKRARAGEDFTKLVREFSEDPAVKQNDGEYSFTRVDQFVPEFKAAAFSLSTNQISDPVTTVYGYHLIKLLEKMPARKEAFNGPETKSVIRKPDGEMASLKDLMSNEYLQKNLKTYSAKIRKEANVEVLDAKLKALEAAADASPIKIGPK